MVNIEWLVKQFINSRLTPEDVRKNLLEGGFPNDLVNQAFEEFRRITGTKKWLTPPPMLVGDRNDETNWYPGADSIPDAKFWPALKNHLLHVKGWPEPAVNSIHQASDRIVAWLQSPYAVSIKTRGLVVGYVQSGKTANFTAVIAKAADAGYRFFIVLSGTKTSLRSQTQQRLEKELLALNSDVWFSPTTMHEFNPIGNVNFFLSDKKHDKVLCVVKKNATVLKKLIAWLSSASPDVLRLCPFLIIDDEADEASINTAKNQANRDPENYDRTAINRHLVKLLQTLPKAAYIGYTATPFANTFIDPRLPDDLYPGDFIVALPKPEGHFGTEQIFGRERLLQDDTDEEFEGVDMARIIPDEELPRLKPSAYDHSFVPEVTPSLQDALRYFWMAAAARVVRGQANEHSTMLIHTTQLIRVHNNTREAVEEYKRHFLKELRGANRSSHLQSLSAQWTEEMTRVPSDMMGCQPVSFSELEQHLLNIIERSEVVVDNSQSPYRLSYDKDPRIQIAIGGNTLSRGLTLEGLTVSFFVRAANAYDTLLQMGRWFGYRPGYADLPRIWMTSELEGDFFDLATIEAEIRQDIESYELMGITPRQFGVRIRTHPDLSITAAAKMQHVVDAQVSYDADHIQTVLFEHRDEKWLNRNIRAADNFIARLISLGFQPETRNGHQIFYDVPVSEVTAFFSSYQFHPNNRALSSKLLKDYILDQNQYDVLERWNVVVRGVTARDRKTRGSILLGQIEVPLLERARREISNEYAHIGVLMSKGDTGADLRRSREELKGLSENRIKELRQQDMPGVGLLVIYPISKDSEPGRGAKSKVALGAAADVIGLGIVFPPAVGESRGAQSYVTVDPTKLDRSGFEPDEEEDEDA